MVGGQAIDLATVTPDPAGTLRAGARRGRRRRHARDEDRRAHPRLGRGSARSSAAAATRRSRRSAAPPASSGSPSRSSTTSSTSKETRRNLGKTPGKDAAAGKPTYPALYGIAALAADGGRRACSAPRPHCTRPGWRIRGSSASAAGSSTARSNRASIRARLTGLRASRAGRRRRHTIRATETAYGPRLASARRRPRPGAVARARAGAAARRTGAGRRPRGDQGRHAGRRRQPTIELTPPDHPYVGRGGLKLAHALDTFGIAVDGPRRARHRRLDRRLHRRAAAARRARASSRSTSATVSSTGRCAPTRGSWSSSTSTRGA